MDTKRTHIVIPQQLAVEIDTLVGKRDRSAFLTQAAEKELMRLRQIKALEGAAGAWKDKDHPLSISPRSTPACGRRNKQPLKNSLPACSVSPSRHRPPVSLQS